MRVVWRFVLVLLGFAAQEKMFGPLFQSPPGKKKGAPQLQETAQKPPGNARGDAREVRPDPGSPPAKQYAQEYFQAMKPFTPGSGWELVGPNVEKCVDFEPEGLRLRLPPGTPGERKTTGLALPTTIQGDFEITLTFEILKEPRPQDVGKTGTRLSLGIFKVDTPRVSNATMSRSVSAQHGSMFVSWANVWNPAKEIHEKSANVFPTRARTGRLCLARRGPDLWFASQEGLDGEWSWRAKYRFGAEDLRRIQIAGSTGGEKASLDARVSDLRIRADALPDLLGMPAGGTASAGAGGNAANRGWFPLALGIGLCLTLLAAGTGGWFILRSRRLAAPAAQVPMAPEEEKGSPTMFGCPQCRKKYRIKDPLVGKQYRCPQCKNELVASEPG